MATTAIQSGLGTIVQFLNRPVIKEGVKNIASTAAFTFGLLEGYDTIQILRGRKISTETHSNQPKWVQVASQIALLCAKISLILSAATSRPGVWIISTLVGSVFSSIQLERVFGPNTIFTVNPWHPRHMFSIAAAILALPALIQSTYQGINWAYTTLCSRGDRQASPLERRGSWLTDTKIRLMASLNTIISRPAQHLGNQLCRARVAV